MQRRGWSVSWLGTRDRHGEQAGATRSAVGHRARHASASPGCAARGCCTRSAVACACSRPSGNAWRSCAGAAPDAVLGMGGYVCFPGGMMAALLGKPLLLVNADASLLLSNKALLPVADRVAFGFDGADAARIKQAVVTGNPVRAEIEAIAVPAERFAGAQRAAAPAGGRRQPGCQGAERHAARRRWRCMPVEQRPRVTHQTGSAQIDAVREAYAPGRRRGRGAALHRRHGRTAGGCDLMVCRAGASHRQRAVRRRRGRRCWCR